ncbi:MAG TPA: hypothetical protein VK196_14025 [Magnetospirillum sp.]|nr:hypothetical protein [Magnetospirillum sp.]
MKAIAILAMLSSLTCAATAALAEENKFDGKIAIEANVANTDEHTGGELGIGYRLSYGRVHLTPYVGAFIHGKDNDRYSEETSKGSTTCRDNETGRNVSTSKCDFTTADAYGKLEATVTAYKFSNSPSGIDIGGGVRFDKNSADPYAALGVNATSSIAVRANIGKDYWAAGLHCAF